MRSWLASSLLVIGMAGASWVRAGMAYRVGVACGLERKAGERQLFEEQTEHRQNEQRARTG